MKYHLKVSALLLVGLLSTGLYSCESTSDEAKETTEVTTEPTAEAAGDSSQKSVQDFFQSLPSPLHVAKIFKRSGLKYISGISNDPATASKYMSNTSRSLNMGVYSADLAYATLNNQNQVAVNYFKSIRTLADGLNMSSIFESTNLIPRFEKNISNQDSLVMLMADLQMESDILLKETNRYDVVYLSFAGAWIESLYIATNLTQKTQNGEIIERIMQQTSALEKLVKLLEAYKTDASVDALIKDLSAVQATMKELKESGKPASDTEYLKTYTGKLYPQIEALRKKIVSEV